MPPPAVRRVVLATLLEICIVGCAISSEAKHQLLSVLAGTHALLCTKVMFYVYLPLMSVL